MECASPMPVISAQTDKNQEKVAETTLKFP